MKLNSKYFDSIRIAKKAEPKASRTLPGCQWKGCANPGAHRAPKGRGRDGDYYVFCLDHVRQYNASYNYFNGMSDAEVERFQKDAITGHRPTWRLGENAAAAGGDPASGAHRYARFAGATIDPYDLLNGKHRPEPGRGGRRALKPLEKKALETLNLPDSADKGRIKTRFKELVKRHHPDANGGDRGSEEKLREIIQAYNYLKQAGLV